MWSSREECSRNREQRQRKEAGILLSLIFSLTCLRDRRPECLKYKKRLDRRKVRSGEAVRGLVGPLKYYLSVRTCDLSFLAHKFAPCMLSSAFTKPLLKGIGWCNYGCCQAQSLQWRLNTQESQWHRWNWREFGGGESLLAWENWSPLP